MLIMTQIMLIFVIFYYCESRKLTMRSVKYWLKFAPQTDAFNIFDYALKAFSFEKRTL